LRLFFACLVSSLSLLGDLGCCIFGCLVCSFCIALGFFLSCLVSSFSFPCKLGGSIFGGPINSFGIATGLVLGSLICCLSLLGQLLCLI
jgi:hypothetical protein